MWNVCTKENEPTIIVPENDSIPEGYTVEAQTCNPNYLDDLKRKVYESDEFLSLFTNEEMLGILNAGDTDAVIKLLLLKLNTASHVDITSDTVINGIQYFVSQNLLTAERAQEILS